MQYTGLGAAKAEQELTVCETLPDLSTENKQASKHASKQTSISTLKTTWRLTIKTHTSLIQLLQAFVQLEPVSICTNLLGAHKKSNYSIILKIQFFALFFSE